MKVNKYIQRRLDCYKIMYLLLTAGMICCLAGCSSLNLNPTNPNEAVKMTFTR